MPPSRNGVVVAATLNNVCNGLAINLETGSKVPAEVRYSDYNQTSARLTRSLAKRESREEDKNKKKSAEAAG
jgi:hypothetical protein